MTTTQPHKTYERMIELHLLQAMRLAHVDNNGCDCSLCRFFPELHKKYQ